MAVITNQIISGVTGFTSTDESALKALLASSGSLSSPMTVFNRGGDSAIVTSDNTATDNAGRIISDRSFVLPGGSMGPNGRLVVDVLWTATWPATGQVANLQFRIGGTVISGLYNSPFVASTERSVRVLYILQNTAVGANRFFNTSAQYGAVSATIPPIESRTIDTTIDQTVDVYGVWNSASTAGATIQIRQMTAQVFYGA